MRIQVIPNQPNNTFNSSFSVDYNLLSAEILTAVKSQIFLSEIGSINSRKMQLDQANRQKIGLFGFVWKRIKTYASFFKPTRTVKLTRVSWRVFRVEVACLAKLSASERQRAAEKPETLISTIHASVEKWRSSRAVECGLSHIYMFALAININKLSLRNRIIVFIQLTFWHRNRSSKKVASIWTTYLFVLSLICSSLRRERL